MNWSNGLSALNERIDVIAEPPGLRAKLVPVEAVAVAVADHVEPQPRLVLAVARRSEQLVHQPLVGVGRRVGEEARPSSGVGGRPVRSNVSAADQRAAVGFGGGLQAGGVETAQDEPVDRVARPSGSVGPPADRRRTGLQRPQVQPLAAEDPHDRVARVGPGVADPLGRRLRFGGRGGECASRPLGGRRGSTAREPRCPSP